MRAFAHAVSEDQFTTYLDPEFTVRNEVDVSAPDRPAAFEGLSGGPAFLTPSEGTRLVPHLCGIVKEGGISSLVPGRLVIHYARPYPSAPAERGDGMNWRFRRRSNRDFHRLLREAREPSGGKTPDASPPSHAEPGTTPATYLSLCFSHATFPVSLRDRSRRNS